MKMFIQIFITALIAALLQWVLHWFPWRMLLRRDLPRLLAYILGMLGIILPVSGLFIYQQAWNSLIALWAVVIASGVATVKAYGLDWLLNRITLSYESQELEHAKTGQDQ